MIILNLILVFIYDILYSTVSADVIDVCSMKHGIKYTDHKHGLMFNTIIQYHY